MDHVVSGAPPGPADPAPTRSYWQRTAPARRPVVPELPATADTVVVGGGLLGACTAYWLARSGQRPLLLDAAELAAGSTGRNSGMVVPALAEPYPRAVSRLGRTTARRVYRTQLAGWRLLREVVEGEGIDCHYRETGHLQLDLTAEHALDTASTVAAIRADGFEAAALDARAVRALVSTELAADLVGGLYLPGALVHSARLVAGVVAAAERYGATVRTGARVTAVETSGDRVRLRVGAAKVEAGAAVLAVNAWTGRLRPELAGLLTTADGQMLATQPLPPIGRPGMSALLTRGGEYWQQALDGTVLLGGCRSVGSGAPEHRLDRAVQQALDSVLPRLFPRLGRFRIDHRWSGQLVFTRDLLPVADRLPAGPVWVVGGFSGHGMPYGMALGQAIAAALTGAPAGTVAGPDPLSLFRLDRTTLREAA